MQIYCHSHEGTSLDPCKEGSQLGITCLAEMPQFLNSANFFFQIFNAIAWSGTTCTLIFYVLLYICFLSLSKLERWLAALMLILSLINTNSIPVLNQDTSRQGFSPDP